MSRPLNYCLSCLPCRTDFLGSCKLVQVFRDEFESGKVFIGAVVNVIADNDTPKTQRAAMTDSVCKILLTDDNGLLIAVEKTIKDYEDKKQELAEKKRQNREKTLQSKADVLKDLNRPYKITPTSHGYIIRVAKVTDTDVLYDFVDQLDRETTGCIIDVDGMTIAVVTNKAPIEFVNTLENFNKPAWLKCITFPSAPMQKKRKLAGPLVEPTEKVVDEEFLE